MAISATEIARRKSYMLAALSYLAKKESLREHLSVGSVRVAGTVEGTIGRALVELPFSGQLHVGGDQQASSSSAPDAAHLITILLSHLTDSQRTRALERLVSHVERHGELPEVDPDQLAVTAAMLKKLRSKKTITRRGSVVFETLPQ